MTQARAPKPADAQPVPKAADEAPARPDGPTRAEVAKAIQAIVRVPVMNRGKPVVERGVYATQERAARADDILAFRADGDRLTARTVDGRKHEIRR